MPDPLIRIDNIGVIHNEGKENEVQSLRRVHLSVYPEEFVIIFGPSGCGKSTLLYTIAGLLTPSYGTVSVRSQDLSKMNNYQRSKYRLFQVGMVFQSFYLISTLSVLDNVCLPKLLNGEETKNRERRGNELLQRFSIAEQGMKYPNELSGGQKQRVAIARALVNDPEIILADEPVGNLDSESSGNVLEILKELNERDKKTIILVTHDTQHLNMADRVISMRDGAVTGEKVQREKRPDEAVKMEQERAVEEMKKTPPDLRMLMRSFQGLTEAQTNVLLVPFKAKQLLRHILLEMSGKQMEAAERYLKELLFGNLSVKDLSERLDAPYETGGAGWNKTRARAFAQRIGDIVGCAEALDKDVEEGLGVVAEHMRRVLSLGLEKEEMYRLESVLRLRVTNKISKEGLVEWLDIPAQKGGAGLRSDVAERVAQEMEIILLLKYS